MLIVSDKTDENFDKNYQMIKKTSLRAGKEKVLWSNSQELRKYYNENDIAVNFVVGFHKLEKGSIFYMRLFHRQKSSKK